MTGDHGSSFARIFSVTDMSDYERLIRALDEATADSNPVADWTLIVGLWLFIIAMITIPFWVPLL